jgi:DNA/RNA-binding protein KIN17
MGKHDSFSPKGIANRIKAKGLQKLKFYCQMCAKQCRDENGFKCHCLSEGHQRQMGIFAENPDKFLDVFSAAFEEGYLELLARRYGARRVNANQVYNEYIQDKEHVHMNSTIWPTLSDFVKYLGRVGKCVIDETERGWHVTWINRDPDALRRQAIAAAVKEADMDDAARHEAELEEAAAAARAAALAELFNDDDDDDAGGGEGGGSDGAAAADGGGDAIAVAAVAPTYTALLRNAAAAAASGGGTGAAAVKITLSAAPSTAAPAAGAGAGGGAGAALSLAGVKRRRFDMEADDDGGAASASAHAATAPAAAAVPPASSSSMARIIQEDLRMKAMAAAGGKPSRFDVPASSSSAAAAAAPPPAAAPVERVRMPSAADAWPVAGAVVKIANAKVGGGAFHRRKGIVTGPAAPDNPWVAVVRVLDDGSSVAGALLKVDQEHLETVLPSPGGRVVVLAGPHRGVVGTLVAIDEAAYSATVRLSLAAAGGGGGGAGAGPVVTGLEYEHVCKYTPEAL